MNIRIKKIRNIEKRINSFAMECFHQGINLEKFILSKKELGIVCRDVPDLEKVHGKYLKTIFITKLGTHVDLVERKLPKYK